MRSISWVASSRNSSELMANGAARVLRLCSSCIETLRRILSEGVCRSIAVLLSIGAILQERVPSELPSIRKQSPLVGFYFPPHGRTQRVPVSERGLQISRCALAVAEALTLDS